MKQNAHETTISRPQTVHVGAGSSIGLKTRTSKLFPDGHIMKSLQMNMNSTVQRNVSHIAQNVRIRE